MALSSQIKGLIYLCVLCPRGQEQDNPAVMPPWFPAPAICAWGQPDPESVLLDLMDIPLPFIFLTLS